MIRVLKLVLLTVGGIATVGVLAGLAWFGTLWAGYNYKWGWVEAPVRYKLTFSVEVGGVTYTGSIVVQVTYQLIPRWQMISQPGIAAIYRGQAGCVKLSDGKMLCLMPDAGYPVYGKDRHSVSAIADRLLSVDGSP